MQNSSLGKTRDQVSQAIGTSHDTLHKVKMIAQAKPKLLKDIDAGKESVHSAYKKIKKERLPAIRQAGIILLPPEQGGMTDREQGKRTDLETSDTDYLKLLDDAGITHGTAQTWQKVARIPEDKFEIYFTEADYYKDEFTISTVERKKTSSCTGSSFCSTLSPIVRAREII